MSETYTKRQHDDTIGGGLFILVVLLIFCIAVTAQCCGCSTVETSEPTYDYAGPDGTLTGVPWELQNYVVEDHDTGVYYFLITSRDKNHFTLCPRYEADGTLWTNPLHDRGAEADE